FSRDRSFYPYALGFHIESYIVGQVLDPLDLHTTVRMDLISGDSRSLSHIGDLSIYVEAVESLFQLHGFGPQRALLFGRISPLPGWFVKQIYRWESIAFRR